MAKKKETENHEDWNWVWPSKTGQAWFPGIILVAIGVVFLLRNVTGFELRNWWAIFILFPALGNFVGAYEHYKASGVFDKKARGLAFWGALMTLLAASFLFGLDFGLIWPVFLILGGLGMLLGAF
jgi:hypothetical protein